MKFKLTLAICALILSPALLFASDEALTITTYYPAPNGNYNNLRANNLAIGSNASVPTADGFVNFKTTSVPIGYTPATGDMYYNGSEFKYYNGGWKGFGGWGINSS